MIKLKDRLGRTEKSALTCSMILKCQIGTISFLLHHHHLLLHPLLLHHHLPPRLHLLPRLILLLPYLPLLRPFLHSLRLSFLVLPFFVFFEAAAASLAASFLGAIFNYWTVSFL